MQAPKVHSVCTLGTEGWRKIPTLPFLISCPRQSDLVQSVTYLPVLWRNVQQIATSTGLNAHHQHVYQGYNIHGVYLLVTECMYMRGTQYSSHHLTFSMLFAPYSHNQLPYVSTLVGLYLPRCLPLGAYLGTATGRRRGTQRLAHCLGKVPRQGRQVSPP